MSAASISNLINKLGESHENLVAQGLISSEKLHELYPGRDLLHIDLEAGLNLSFWAETKQFEALFITLKKVMSGIVEYTGELPPPYSSEMTQSDVHAIFGQPMESRGPIKMPKPMGQTGGWESYPLDPAIYPGKKIVFQYTAAMEVKTLIFTLIDKGHD
ncbi:hypothetical protein PS862_01969 [Pseudomonas fluorescens]|uniref:Pyocin immunity protein n=1 Tax=Pseudomonas fluorescens TaxID=294 RepID=A0A5E6UIQ3_PSEFL|nr:DUF6392 family protein [Pseudomonas fluorescens]VVN04768.1 hypothetical protein PS639_03475 [Pseudomonas fluorescens]VVO83793.1 hypothetical protein PS862_01969 [Pseudomonas fluorescens]